ncbi:hypothetical protein [Nocardioides aquaticus]|uniref:hypothetical protein n=1 Tax=Nocardioides aquaticus TaxID=160826 RepID=UPI001BD2CF5F|nr:hypothetical protein [Nocardioides aquaticus]
MPEADRSDAVLTTYERAPQLPGILLGRLGVFHGAVTLGSSLLVAHREDVSWDGTHLTYAGSRYAVGDTFSAGGGQTTVGRLKQVATPPGWPDNAGAVVVRRPDGAS